MNSYKSPHLVLHPDSSHSSNASIGRRNWRLRLGTRRKDRSLLTWPYSRVIGFATVLAGWEISDSAEIQRVSHCLDGITSFAKHRFASSWMRTEFRFRVKVGEYCTATLSAQRKMVTIFSPKVANPITHEYAHSRRLQSETDGRKRQAIVK
jgi:hypothetical protein